MFKINDRLATHGFEGNARVTNLEMKYCDLEKGHIEDFTIVDVRLLNDGVNNEQAYLYNINRVIELLDSHHKVVICCEAGQSRSNAIALGVLVAYFKMDFYEAWDLISYKVPISMIDPSHIASIKKLFKVDDDLFKCCKK